MKPRTKVITQAKFNDLIIESWNIKRGLISREIQLREILKDEKINNFEWLGLSYGYSCSPNHSKTGPLKIRTFLSGFHMVFEKMPAIYPDLKW